MVVIIKPFLKKSTPDPSLAPNSRPVSYLTFVSKALEETVADQLYALEQKWALGIFSLNLELIVAPKQLCWRQKRCPHGCRQWTCVYSCSFRPQSSNWSEHTIGFTITAFNCFSPYSFEKFRLVHENESSSFNSQSLCTTELYTWSNPFQSEHCFIG